TADFAVIDCDALTPEQYEHVLRETAVADAVVYTSPTDQGPGSPIRKARIIVRVDRPIQPHECVAVRKSLAQELGVVSDDSVDTDPSKFLYWGRIAGTPKREVKVHSTGV